MTRPDPIGARRLTRRGLLRTGGAALATGVGSSVLTGCGGGGAGSSDAVELSFMYWGSAFEKKAIDSMLQKFDDSHDKIDATAKFVPTSNYDTKMSSIVAAKTPPDVAYLSGSQLYDFAGKGLILNLFPYLKKYPALGDRLPSSYFWYGKDKLAANQLAQGVQILYYNSDLFGKAGLDPAPFTVDTAWSWDDFVEAATKLTLDDQGRNPSQSGFDPKKVRQYGTIAPTGGSPLYALLRSAGADFINDDGTKYAMDSAAAITVIKNVQDLIYKHRVAPTPAQLGKNAPTTSVQLQTKRIAMIIDGNWQMLDLMEQKVPFGVACLPKYDEPITVTGGAAGAIFQGTKHPEQAVELYLYYNDPANVDLFSDGLWAPLQTKYYTDPKLVDTWVTDKYPANFKTAVVEPTLKNGVIYWGQNLKNTEKIDQQVTPATDQIGLGKDVATVVKGLKGKVEPLLQGMWPTQEL
ncbi:ABC transporter substrate-binding protein [Microlunatus soli]|uniref:Carbohydrate ABC transporter substrate-binding protein, CUT1 family n=1 Tax=Microlunatus soli TaxID=630515 RepID=A0A1H1YMF7_9ACTN|nr:sugar ABC transporter substrate-binding protein [Microlunatus soli]SDT22590.1 carbohydrate ABC transporter substrate-binding protein, CUT1 family [Microlunatus soli]